MKITELQVRLSDGQDLYTIRDLLAARYDIRREGSFSEERTYYDTFDWLLYEKSLALYRSDNAYVLHNLEGDEEPACVEAAATATFAADLPEGALRDEVASAIKVRALLELADIRLNTTVYGVLNTDQKIVSRVVCMEAPQVGDSEDSARVVDISIHPVRGYKKESKMLKQDLTRALDIFQLDRRIDSKIYHIALTSNGQVAGSYSSSLDLNLDPAMRSDDAARMILRQLLKVIKANEFGIRADIDVEFLHDYRVAIRRTRSALSQIPNVFPNEETDRYKEGFRTLGQRTNALRDLDVYLLAESDYRAMLPALLRDDISPLFEYLRLQREQALADVVDSLDAPETAHLLADWEAFLGEGTPEETSASNASIPILELSQKRIYGRYRNIIKRGMRLQKHAKDELMHALRIDCKKLRYLLEFFFCLYPPDKMKRLIQELKLLQDNLGDFNDLSVQQLYLLGVAKELPMDDKRTGAALLATGALVDVLARRQQLAREEYAERFEAFAAKANRNLYKELFGDV